MEHARDVPLEARLLAALPLGVFWIKGGVIRWANQALAEILETRLEAVVGTDPFSYVDEAERETVAQRHLSRLRGEPQPDNYELTLTTARGRRTRVVIEPRPMSEDESVVLIRDVNAEVRSSELLVALGELAARVQRARTSRAVLETAATGLQALGMQVAVFRAEGEVAKVAALAVSPGSRAWLEGLAGLELDKVTLRLSEMPSSRRVLEERRPLFIEDALPAMRSFVQGAGRSPPPDFEEQLRKGGVSKLLLAPLTVSGESWGFLVVSAGRFLSSDAAALSLFASQLSAALDVAQSIEELELHNRRLEAIHLVGSIGAEVPQDELIRQMLEAIREFTHSDAVILYRADREAGALVAEGSVGSDEALVEKYARLPLSTDTFTGRTAVQLQARAISSVQLEGAAADMLAAGLNQAAVIPLLLNGRMAGTVNLARRSHQRYGEEELRTAQVLMTQVALQLERSRLYAEARRRVEDLSLINELGGLIAQHLELEKVLETAMRHGSRIVDVKNTFLLLVDETEQQVRIVASNLPDPEVLEVRLPLNSPAASTAAMASRAPVVIADCDNDPRAMPALSLRFNHRALMSVPLMSEGRAIGALVFGETRGPREFTRSEVNRAVAIANQLATAVEHARLFTEQSRRVAQLELLVDMSQVITGSLELRQILQATANSLVRMIDATDAFIWLLEDTSLQGVVSSDPALQERFSGVRLSLGDTSAVSLAVVSREPVRLEDATTSAVVNRELNSHFQQRSLLALPLMLRDVPIGAISIGDRRRKRAFTDDEVERALLISRQVAVAIDNARLFENLKRSYQELARAQKELVKKERLAALGELSAVVAHEVRNPLGVIFNSLVSLKRMAPQSSDGRMLLEIVGEEADRLNRMVSDLLDFARPNEAQLRPENVAEVLRGALEAAARAMPSPQVQFAFETAPGLRQTPLDAQMMRQAVVNLVVNAIQAMPKGGKVTVRAATEDRPGARFVKVEVEDNGPGIPPELVERLFQPFFTTRAAGTGLGLAVVKRIADAHHAEISVRSTPGKGSTFTLWLPG